MKNKKAVALVLAASTSATLVMAKSAITAHADTLSKGNTKSKNMKTYMNKGKVVNVTSGLRVRQGASINNRVIGYLKNGNEFNIISKEGNWYKIEFNGSYGYVYGEYVTQLNKPSKTWNNGESIGTGTVINIQTNLRFRSGPSTNNEVLGYFINGQAINVIGQTNGWYQVNYDGQIGYVDGQYINYKPVVTNAPNNNVVKKSEVGGVVHVRTNLRVRTSATTKSNVIGTLYEGNKVHIIGRDNDWYKIDLGNGTSGYVCVDYIQTLTNTATIPTVDGNMANSNVNKPVNNTAKEVTSTVQNTTVQNKTTAKVNPTSSTEIVNNKVVNNTANNKVTNSTVKQTTNNTVKQAANNTVVPENTFGEVTVPVGLRIRSGATVNSSIVGALQDGAGFKIVAKVGDWYKISANGVTGYVFGDYVKLVKSLPQSTVKTNNKTNTSKENNTVKNTNTVKANNTSANTSVKTNTTTATTSNKAAVQQNNNSNSQKNTTASTPQITTENAVGQVANISANLRVRTAPNTNCSVIGYLLNGQNVNITGKQGNWYRIKLDNGNTGYVYSSYINIVNGVKPSDVHTAIKNDQNNGVITYSNKFGQVININSSLRIRSAADTNSSVVGYLLNGQGVKVLAKTGNWYKINNNGQIGYVYGQYIKFTNKLVNANLSVNTNNATNTSNNSNSNSNNKTATTNNNNSNTSSVSTNNATFETVFSILKEEVGAPYVWGGSGQYVTTSLLQQLSNEFPGEANAGDYNVPAQYVNHGYRGFDCSGLMDWAFSQVGINIGRTTYQQATAGRAVSLNDVRPGDLLFFKGDVHVGMYIGNGQWIVSPHSHAYVRICNVPWSLIGSARRVLN
ncbi:SH3 domain-containing protein [uncultured Clostridium sp.]|uniref:SH3 domain-containing protein n=1 Tax=uncultured Clostridium sp. TaxID=59620 RepID=UPI0026192E34|nr:SH3 domain-containing protein [uncultured Clostridium sp.]